MFKAFPPDETEVRPFECPRSDLLPIGNARGGVVTPFLPIDGQTGRLCRCKKRSCFFIVIPDPRCCEEEFLSGIQCSMIPSCTWNHVAIYWKSTLGKCHPRQTVRKCPNYNACHSELVEESRYVRHYFTSMGSFASLQDDIFG